MRPALAALALSGLTGLACTARDVAQCPPGETVAVLHLKGPIAYQGDPRAAVGDPALDALPDCRPSPFIASGVDQTGRTFPAYPHLVAFDAKLTVDAVTGTAALCRPDGMVYSGVRTGATHYAVQADAGPAAPCASSACAATLRVVVAGDVSLGAGGAPDGFDGILVEALTQEAGACGECLPPVPNATPPALACAARYALTGTTR